MNIKPRTAILTLFIAVVAILLLAQSPASAHHKDGHDSGPSEEATQEDSETTSEDSESEAGSDDSDEAADDGTREDRDGGWSSFRTRAAADREQQGTSTTTTTTTSTNPGGQVCDGSRDSDSGDGANRSGPGNPYQNTCGIGDPASGNGQGNAQPCAGCVGNADDKFPPGQEPDASDENNGYECDGNEGIAKTNPAHTGCVTPPTVVCDADEDMPGIQPCISGNPPNPPRRPPVPPGPPRIDVVLPRPPIRFNPPDVVRNVPPGILPVTGGSPLGFFVLGLSMIATGTATLGHKRVRRGARRKI